MPKHLCLSCFNTAVDIQAFIESGVNFQKTTVGQLFPNAKVEEACERSFISGYHGNSHVAQRANKQFAEQSIKHSELTEDRSQDFLSCCSNLVASGSGLINQSYSDKAHGHDLTIEQDVNNRTHIIESYQDSQGIFESCESVDKHGITLMPNINYHRLKPPDEIRKTDESQSVESIHSRYTTSAKQVLTNDEGNCMPTLPRKDSTVTLSKDEEKVHAHATPELSSNDSHNVTTSQKNWTETQPSTSSAMATFDEKCKKCPTCHKSFPRKSLLKSHLACHSENRPYECNICSLKFKYRRNLVEHSSIHVEIPSFICSVCGLTFKQKSK